jgi:MoaA/NifB/PqqE/SkfB family radical SAM enzyme
MAESVTYRAPLKAPLSVCIWISDVCNLSCKYCYASPFSGKIMETARLYQILDELINLQVFGIVLAGGEPFMHPDIFKIIEYCVDRNVQVGVLSNGILLDKTAIHKLSTIVKNKRFILQISLDSIQPETNDLTRGAGCTIIENIKELCKTDIRMQMATVITKYNVETAHRVIEAFYPAIKRYHFLNVQRTEKSLKNPNLLISGEQAKKFWLGLKEYARKFPEDLFLPSLRIMLRAAKAEDSVTMNAFHQQATFDCKTCSVGLTHINIDAEFNVLGCDIAKDFTNMGNVLKQSFSEVWNSKQAHEVRTPNFPPCYKNKTPEGEALQDYLKDEFIHCLSAEAALPL